MTLTNIIAGFKKTGIFFLDEHIFDKCDFLPSLVTDQPNDASTSIKYLEENESFHNVDFLLQGLGSLNDVEIQNLETFRNNFLSPEQVIGYPKALGRKKRHQKRKKGCSMILTDVHKKELLKSYKKVQKAPKRKAKYTRKRLYSNKSSNVDEIQILLSDLSSGNFSDPCDVEKNLLVPDCTNEPAIDDYVLIEFKRFPRKYYVGQIIKNKDFEGDYEISYMWKKRNVTEFFLHEVTDLTSVKEKDIRAVLLAPKECGSTSCQRSALKFHYNFFSSMYINS